MHSISSHDLNTSMQILVINYIQTTEYNFQECNRSKRGNLTRYSDVKLVSQKRLSKITRHDLLTIKIRINLSNNDKSNMPLVRTILFLNWENKIITSRYYGYVDFFELPEILKSRWTKITTKVLYWNSLSQPTATILEDRIAGCKSVERNGECWILNKLN